MILQRQNTIYGISGSVWFNCSKETNVETLKARSYAIWMNCSFSSHLIHSVFLGICRLTTKNVLTRTNFLVKIVRKLFKIRHIFCFSLQINRQFSILFYI